MPRTFQDQVGSWLFGGIYIRDPLLPPMARTADRAKILMCSPGSWGADLGCRTQTVKTAQAMSFLAQPKGGCVC